MILETVILILMLLVAGGIVAWLWRPRARLARLRHVEADRKFTPHRCVSIRYGTKACQAVKRLEGKRFLSAEAPSLPLLDCEVEHCRCRYVDFGDRRQGGRRDTYTNGYVSHHGGQEHRSGRDRRRPQS